MKTSHATAIKGKDKDGFYDGCAALKFVEKWLVEAQRDAPQYTFFDKAHGAIDGKLTAGCSEREFNAVADSRLDQSRLTDD